MTLQVVDKDPQYVLNLCTKYLARDSTDPRHNFDQYEPGDPRAAIAEAWRFPVVDSHWDGVSAATSYPYDDVTFVWDGLRNPATDVALVSSLGELYDPVPLKVVDFGGLSTGLLSLTVRAPKGQIHYYRFLVDGISRLDPVNPQTTQHDNGASWSRFFTSGCAIPITLGRRQRELLTRLVAHLLPFRLEENRVFVRQVYQALDRTSRDNSFPFAYKLDQDVGVTNYIDKLLAREESHHVMDYQICLRMIDSLLRSRILGRDPLDAPIELYQDLYDQMAADQVPGWDTTRYQSPQYFLLLLRRHAMTGAFVHPRHGGNSGGVGWEYLESRFTDAQGATLFDWRRALEFPLGHNTDYRG